MASNILKIYTLALFLLPLFTNCSENAPSIESLDIKIEAEEFIYETADFPQSHASTIAETDEGLIAAWFGGTHEKHPDVSIYSSTYRNGEWSSPLCVADGVINDTLRYPCWNPVLYKLPKGPLMLFYKVGPNVHDWWGELKKSYDNGKTWSEAERLPEGFLGPIKNKPVLINDSILIAPSSTERKSDDDWRVHFEISKDFGETWEFVGPISKENRYDIIQPSILSYDDGRLQMLARSKEDYVMSSWSSDNGQTWSEPEHTTLPNPNSGTDAVTLQNGLQLIVYNHSHKEKDGWGGPRTQLSIALSEDGENWIQVLTLEDEDPEDENPAEFSYPAVIQGENGDIHITYTYNRDTIKYVRLKIG